MYWINLIGTTLFSMLAGLIFTCNVSKLKLSTIMTKNKILYYIILNILFFLNALFMKDLNKVLINLFILVLMNMLIIFNSDYKKSTYFTFIFILSQSIIEVLLSLISLLVLNFNNKLFLNSPIAMLIFSFCSMLITIGISNINKLSGMILKIYKISTKKIYNLILLIISTLYVILLTFNNFKTWENNIQYYINFGLILFIVISIFIVTYNSINKSKIEDKYNQMLEYVTKYEGIINEQGKRNHEFNNQLMVLQGYLNDKKKLKEYLNIIIDDQKGGQNFRIKQLGYLPDGGLKGLLYYKLSKMEEKDIKSFLYVSNNMKKSFNDIDVGFYQDITKIFGVFIDNAIDAASEADKKEIVIDIRKDDDSLVIVISNTFKNNDNINKIGKKGYTSKGSGHGFGLSIVKDITKKNDNIESFSDIENGMFKQTLIIYLK